MSSRRVFRYIWPGRQAYGAHAGSALRARNYSSKPTTIPVVPFSISKTAAFQAFKDHHRKDILTRQPVRPPIDPTPKYLPYYIFSGKASINFSTSFQSNTVKQRAKLPFKEIDHNTHHHDISNQTLSAKYYDSQYPMLHIYGSYEQFPIWLSLDSSRVISLATTNGVREIDGITPKTEPFTVPIEGAKARVLESLLCLEKVRAKHYLETTFQTDPETIKVRKTSLRSNLQHQKIYLPVWIFEFMYFGSKNITYVSGWNESMSGPVFMSPWLFGPMISLATFITILKMTGQRRVAAPYDLKLAGVLVAGSGVLAMLWAEFWPILNRMMAELERDELQDNDEKAKAAASKRDFARDASDWFITEEEYSYKGRQLDDPKGLYAALDVKHGASDVEIHNSYRRLAKKYHPDMVQGDDSRKEKARKQFQEVSAAYEVLRNKEKRRRYDRYGAFE